MADQAPRVSIDYTLEGDVLGIQPVVTDGGGATLYYELEVSVKQGSNRSRSQQSGYSTIADDAPTALTSTRIGYSEDATYRIRLRVTDGQRTVASIEEEYR